MTDQIVLGLVFPFQGRAAWVSRASLEGIELAIEQARADGAALSERIRLARSDASTPEAARAEARRLIEREGARLLLGSAVSAICLAASEVAEERGVLYWEVAAVADEVTTRGLRTIFRLNANAQDFAAEAIRFVRSWLPAAVGPVERVAVIHESSPFGSSVGRAVVAAARAAGLSVAVAEAFEAGAAAQLSGALERIGAARPDALLATAGAREAAAIVRARADALRDVGAIVGVGGGWGSPELSAELGGALDGTFSVNNARALRLRAEGLGREARETWHRYREACAARGIDDPQADRDLSFIGMDLLLRRVLPAAPDLSLDRLREAACALDVPHGGTITGMGVRFDATGHNNRGIVVAMQWQAGTLRTVAPPELATDPIARAGGGAGRGSSA